jgi:uncharacterized protein (TIGR02452 family)
MILIIIIYKNDFIFLYINKKMDKRFYWNCPIWQGTKYICEREDKIRNNIIKYNYEQKIDIKELYKDKEELYKEDKKDKEYFYKDKKDLYRDKKIILYNDCCINVAIDMSEKYNDKKICLWNFANPNIPGLSLTEETQEEEIIRATDFGLYELKEYYPLLKHFLYVNDCDIVRYSNRNNYKQLENPFKIDILTVAAKNYRYKPVEFSIEEREENQQMLDNIFKSMIIQKCDIAIIGALGMGMFNNPDEMLELIISAAKTYLNYFDQIIFSIIDQYESKNYKKVLELL